MKGKYAMRLMRFISCVFMLWWGGSAIAESYFAQIKASKYLHEVQIEKDKVEALHLHPQLSQVELDGVVLYRLRLGPFSNKDDAEKIAKFVGYDDVWIVSSSDEPTIRQVTESAVAYDAPLLPVLLLGHDSPYAVFFKKVRGMGELNILGTSIFLVTPGYQKEIDDVTGIREGDGMLEVGVFTEVYQDPEGKPVSEFKQSITEFADTYDVDVRSVEKNLKYFGDAFAVGFTLRKQIDLDAGEISLVGTNGFDYYGKDGGTTYSGNIDYKIPLGNITMTKINQGLTGVESDCLTVITMTNDYEVRAMMLFERDSER